MDCPKCGSLIETMKPFCGNCGFNIDMLDNSSVLNYHHKPLINTIPSHMQPTEVPLQRKKDNNLKSSYYVSLALNIFIIALFMVQLLYSPLVLPMSEEDEEKERLEKENEDLTLQYKNLEGHHNQLGIDYHALQREFNELNKEWEFYNNINVGHFMGSCYEAIRDIYDEQWDSFWWNIIGDDEDVITFAANLAEHDLGRIYWTNINEKYRAKTGENMNFDASQKLSLVINFLEIGIYDSDIEKIQKILAFVNDWVSYEPDLNEKFLSPIETLTFRSGDCDDFAILVSALFELVDLESGIVFVTNDDGDAHAMVILHREDLGPHGYYYFEDLTNHGLEEGRWILIEPQSIIENQHNEDWMEQWSGKYFCDIDVHL